MLFVLRVSLFKHSNFYIVFLIKDLYRHWIWTHLKQACWHQVLVILKSISGIWQIPATLWHQEVKPYHLITSVVLHGTGRCSTSWLQHLPVAVVLFGTWGRMSQSLKSVIRVPRYVQIKIQKQVKLHLNHIKYWKVTLCYWIHGLKSYIVEPLAQNCMFHLKVLFVIVVLYILTYGRYVARQLNGTLMLQPKWY